MDFEMIEKLDSVMISGRFYKVRKYTRRSSNNDTLVIGSSLLKYIKNEKFDTISISGARVETVHEYMKTFPVENYEKIGILAGGNNLRSWNGQEADSTLKVCSLLKLDGPKGNIHIFLKNVCSCPVFD